MKHQTILAVLALSGLRRACIEVRLSRLAEKTRCAAPSAAATGPLRFFVPNRPGSLSRGSLPILCGADQALFHRLALLLWRESTKERLCILANPG